MTSSLPTSANTPRSGPFARQTKSLKNPLSAQPLKKLFLFSIVGWFMSLYLLIMMNSPERFTDFTREDFVWNEHFRKWVLSPDEELNIFWNDWLIAHADKKQIINAAKEIILCLNIDEPQLSEESINEAIQDTLNQIEVKKIEPQHKNSFKAIRYKKYWQAGIAASVIMVLAVSLVVWLSKSLNHPSAYQELVQSSGENLLEKQNQSDKPMSVFLDDGSKILLEKDARISYAASFNHSNNRKVYLSGNAFFEVAKNPAKPFLVYANGLITKVVGTQFKIHSSEADKKVSVEVISGMVSVYSYINKKPKEETSSKKLNSLILTANQKANYSGEDKTLMATIVENPVIVSTHKIDFKFEDTPVDFVFRSITNAYGIEILYDEKSFANRTFTSALTTETLYEKLDIICKALNARYEVIDGKIVVYNNAAAK